MALLTNAKARSIIASSMTHDLGPKLSPPHMPVERRRISVVQWAVIGFATIGAAIFGTWLVSSSKTRPENAELRDFTLVVPRDKVFSHPRFDPAITGGERSVRFDICDRHGSESEANDACALHSPHGSFTIVRDVRPASRFDLLKQRPVTKAVVSDDPLVPLAIESIPPLWPRSTRSEEGYALRRLESIFTKDQPFVSTEVGWPIAKCGVNPHFNSASCTFAFLLDGAFVEVHWYPPAKRPRVTQRELWDAASDVDGKIRSIMRTRDAAVAPLP